VDARLSKCDLRDAQVADLPALLAIENQSFDSDRINRRSFRHFLSRGHARLRVLEADDTVIGYALLLFRNGLSLARLYSLAVLPAARGHGFAQQLLSDAEDCAREAQCAYLRLEVREDNLAAQRLYQQAGYRNFELVDDYYEDHATALRLEKRLQYPNPPSAAGARLEVPYYAQTTDFTCGPSALLMAMGAQSGETVLDQSHELAIWREATTIFMTSGHGGCGPHGLALAAWRRGHAVQMYLNLSDTLFARSVRSEQKRRVIELVQREFERELAATGVEQHDTVPNASEVLSLMGDGWVPLALISTWRIDRKKAPHWVTLSACDDQFVYLHDPDREQYGGADFAYLPVGHGEFAQLARFGGQGLRALVLVGPRRR
jgi:ribosomal-protein-alanine acetyltransferase